jgi:hypothetical protein
MKRGGSSGYKGNSETTARGGSAWAKATRKEVQQAIAQGYIANHRVRPAAKKLGLAVSA